MKLDVSVLNSTASFLARNWLSIPSWWGGFPSYKQYQGKILYLSIIKRSKRLWHSCLVNPCKRTCNNCRTVTTGQSILINMLNEAVPECRSQYLTRSVVVRKLVKMLYHQKTPKQKKHIFCKDFLPFKNTKTEKALFLQRSILVRTFGIFWKHLKLDIFGKT